MSILLPSKYLEFYLDPEQDAAANGQGISEAYDRSPNGRTLTASSPYPVCSTGAIGGKRVYTWDGNANPLANAATFPVQCGFVVVKINESTFHNYSGVLTAKTIFAVLTGENGATNFFDFLYDGFEYRINDSVSLNSVYPAPINVYKVIYFRFRQAITFPGIQFGQDRDDANRKARMSLALAALYSDSSPFDEPQNLRNAEETLAAHFALYLAPENPINNPNYTRNYRESYTDDGEDYEETTVKRKYQDAGVSFNELVNDAPQEWTLNYEGLSAAQVEIFDAHWRACRVSRPFQLLTKKKTVLTVFYKEKPKRSYNARAAIYGRRITLIRYPSSSGILLTDTDYLIDA